MNHLEDHPGISSKEDALESLRTLGMKLRDERRKLDEPTDDWVEVKRLVRDAIKVTIQAQFGDDFSGIDSMVEQRYLEVCEQGLPNVDELELLRNNLLFRVESRMQDDVSLTSFVLGIFQQIHVAYCVSQLRGEQDIQLNAIPLTYHGHIAPRKLRANFEISDEQAIEAIRDGWRSA